MVWEKLWLFLSSRSAPLLGAGKPNVQPNPKEDRAVCGMPTGVTSRLHFRNCAETEILTCNLGLMPFSGGITILPTANRYILIKTKVAANRDCRCLRSL